MRRIVAKAIRKMQTPAYCPVVSGAKDFVHRSVVVEVKKTMFICSMSIALELEVDMGIELPVELVMPIFILCNKIIACL
jgi:hypothetical protein